MTLLPAFIIHACYRTCERISIGHCALSLMDLSGFADGRVHLRPFLRLVLLDALCEAEQGRR